MGLNYTQCTHCNFPQRIKQTLLQKYCAKLLIIEGKKKELLSFSLTTLSDPVLYRLSNTLHRHITVVCPTFLHSFECLLTVTHDESCFYCSVNRHGEHLPLPVRLELWTIGLLAQFSTDCAYRVASPYTSTLSSVTKLL